eukprot:1157604-Pelagomonas_calceolata.AAC.4
MHTYTRQTRTQDTVETHRHDDDMHADTRHSQTDMRHTDEGYENTPGLRSELVSWKGALRRVGCRSSCRHVGGALHELQLN